MLYTWNILWLMADGLFLTIQVVMKGPQWWQARKAFKALGEPWTAKFVRDGWLAAIEDVRNRFEDPGPAYEIRDKEREWIENWAMKDERYGHLYARLLKRYIPKFMDQYPYGGGLWAHLKIMVLGVVVRQPWYCYPLEQ